MTSISTRSSRKRDHEEAFAEDNSKQRSSENGDQSPEDDEEQELEKERQIWENLREEHYEVIEQMPLQLHRQYALMRDLDQQVHGYYNDLLPTLLKYIERRFRISEEASQNTAVETSEPLQADPDQPPDISSVETRPNETEHEGIKPHEDSQKVLDVYENMDIDAPHIPQPTTLTEDKEERPESRSRRSSSPIAEPTTPSNSPLKALTMAFQNLTPRTPMARLQSTLSLTSPRTPGTPMGVPKERTKPPETTREMLSHIAWLSEEIYQASEEKYNLAHTTRDSVERQIRLLDQAIKEQEAFISLGARPGTHLAPILLPDIIAPTRPIGNRKSGRSLSPESVRGIPDPESHPAVVHKSSASARGNSGRGRGRGRGRPSNARTGLKITLPPSGIYLSSEDKAGDSSYIDPNLYCYCKRVSHGDMVMCDRADCEGEWFHLGCTNLDGLPPENVSWYCKFCAEKNEKEAAARKKPKGRSKRR